MADKKMKPPRCEFVPMSRDDVACHMLEYAEAVKQLAESLCDAGRPLNKAENEMIRQAYLGLITDQLDEVKVFYMAGLIDHVERAMDNAMETMHQLDKL